MYELKNKDLLRDYEFGSERHIESLGTFSANKKDLYLYLGIEDNCPEGYTPKMERADHNAMLIGMPGSGVSNAVAAIMGSVALLYDPDELQIMYADFRHNNASSFAHSLKTGSTSERLQGYALIPNMIHFENCSQVGDISAFITRLEHLRDARIECIKEHGLRSFEVGCGIPMVLVVMDNSIPIPFLLTRDLLERLSDLLKCSHESGMHYIMSGVGVSAASGMQMQFFQDYFGMRLCLRTDEQMAYAVDCPLASELSMPGYLVCRTHDGSTQDHVYRVPLVKGASLFETFKVFLNSKAYECKQYFNNSGLYLRKRE